MLQLFAIAVGGAVGAIMRFAMSNGVYKLFGRDFPYGTLAVNVLGSLLIGVLFILLIEKLAVAAEWRAGLLVGLLGAFTTFSTFSLETFTLMENGAFLKAGLNVFLSVVLCLAATWLGISLGRQL
ncbi:MAG TPA: fluoride efflux transporter CrcB [Methylophaga sp.]|uniref:fluoride efflux transporter CrcB n=1 Tax=unclassified Methylophaga TaxID=2629249 RepID=UPI000C939E3C|nr:MULTISPECIES: fluoride efflux transporter CrcB [unclassified Methylophaga]MAP28170.1 fluoride efflux transporter CrcB [Methylophaga sp.]HAD30602.1 fluoride efflux transporter CrcB [Methylophaga sp.]HBX59874.1 fluoride efflux transporter CrcB [Methylophaga sp.]HCN99592.1 fluoride efflux transporter CrcB [Methylophaga sp.]